MAQVELKMPKMGESVAEATVISWLKNEGDQVEADEVIVEIATDKVDSEIPSEVEGVLIKKMCDVDDVIQVGQTIAIIETDSEIETDSLLDDDLGAIEAETEKLMEKSQSDVQEGLSDTSEKFYSPLVKNMAKEEGITLAELDSQEGSGKDGRFTKADMIAYIEEKKSGSVSAPISQASPVKEPKKKIEATKTPAPQPVFVSGQDEIIEMDRMRKLISEHMVMSKQVSPHVTSFVEADVTRIVKWRDAVKDKFQEREGSKITFTPIFIEAVVKAIKDFPMINISVDGDKIIKRGNINIGMATALPSGNLIVPVIKNADNMNLLGITKSVNDLASRARNNKLGPDDISGGTYTVTNVGSFGNVMGTPIINQPQVAILALGAIRKLPAVVETPEGDVIAIRHKMFLSHAYDHRVVDGALGGMFVKRVAEYLEAFDPNREI